ncbi:hypothetical protein Tco_1032725 [Tanacetum coccineum]|uniref:Uncharacterized protein n=1 Tax=Tanacetum coccineum TaxID=301880 RepID=A0ABQ5GDG5_9ASTR
MNENQKFEQIWGFRRNVDSSSDDSKSNFDAVKDQEKLGLVPENDRVSETNDPKVQVAKNPKRKRKSAPKKEKNNTGEVKTKKKDSSASSKIKKGYNNSKKKKSKLISQMTIPDDFRIFTESILNDLRVARETMFSKMRKEMDQLVNPKPSRSIKKKASENNPTKKPTPKPRVRKPKTSQAKPKQKSELATSKGLDHPQEQVNNGNANAASAKSPILSNNSSKSPILIDNSPKNPILIDVSAKNPILLDTFSKNPILNDAMSKTPIFTNAPDQVTTSSYLTVPFVTPNSRPNNTSSTLESGNYYGLQTYRQNSTESSCFGNGYPVEFNHHQRMHNSNDFGIPSQVQGLSHDNPLGTRMMHGGGMRYNAGLSGHAFPNNLALNGFRNLYPN